MQSTQQAEFSQEVAQAHRHALKALYDILENTSTPVAPNDTAGETGAAPQLTEAQRLSLRLRAATALLRVKDPKCPGDAENKKDTDDDEQRDDDKQETKAASVDADADDDDDDDDADVDDQEDDEVDDDESDGDARRPSSSSSQRRVSRLKSPRPLTPAQIKAAKGKATFDYIARANKAAYEDLLALEARRRREREAAATKLPPAPHPFASIPAWQQYTAEQQAAPTPRNESTDATTIPAITPQPESHTSEPNPSGESRPP